MNPLFCFRSSAGLQVCKCSPRLRCPSDRIVLINDRARKSAIDVVVNVLATDRVWPMTKEANCSVEARPRAFPHFLPDPRPSKLNLTFAPPEARRGRDWVENDDR